MAKIELAAERDLGQLIGDPFLFARQNFKLLLRAFLYFIVPPLLIVAALAAFGMADLFTGLNHTSGTAATPAFPGSSLLTVVSAYLLFIIVTVFQQVYVSEYLVIYEKNKEAALRDIWTGLKQDWKNIVVTLLALIPITVLAGTVFFLVIASSAVIGKTIAGFIAFAMYLFLIYAMLPLSNIFMVRLREKTGIFKSLAKCFKITAGKWWRTFLAFMLTFLIYYSLVLFMILPFYAAIFFVVLHGANISSFSSFYGYAMGIYLTLVVVWSFLLMNIFYIFIGINYYSLSEKYDNFHLRQKIQDIGEREETGSRKQEGEY